jgi:hypothetical protein
MTVMTDSERIKIVFCLPGNTYSNTFLIQWSELLVSLERSGKYDAKLSNGYSSFVTFARAKCLGADVQRGPKQKPFGGQVPYDVLVWIDSDIIFTTDQVIQLVDAALHDHPVVSGLYMMSDGTHFAAVRDWDDAFFVKNSTYKFLTMNDLEKGKGKYIPCAYAGMGFMAIRKGILEQLDYPWFIHDPYQIGTLLECCSEDVALCRNLIEKKIVDAVMVRPDIRVAHEKRVLL